MEGRSAHEARLLAVERGIESLDSRLRALRRRAIAVGQGAWAAWSDVSGVQATPAPAPAPPPTPSLPGCCSGIPTTTSIPFTDSVWGSGNLVWDGSANWTAWLSGLAYPGGGGCAAETIAVHYALNSGNANLTVEWLYANATGCPVASTAGFISPPAGQLYSSIGYAPGLYCDTSPMTGVYEMGTTTQELALRQGHSSQIITLTFSGTTATNGTSDFSGVCSCIPWVLTLVDSVYGNVTLTYDPDPAVQSWIGCTTWSYPGTVNCAAGTIAVQYSLAGSIFAGNWNLTVNWAGHTVSGHACPLPGATCSSTLNASRTVSVSASLSCSGLNKWIFAPSSNSPWPGTGAATCSITL